MFGHYLMLATSFIPTVSLREYRDIACIYQSHGWAVVMCYTLNA